MEDEDTPENPDNLPGFVLPTIPAVGPANSNNEVIEADAIRMEVVLQRLTMEIPKMQSVQALCKLAKTTADISVIRRHLLNRQYGTASKGKDDGIVDPLD